MPKYSTSDLASKIEWKCPNCNGQHCMACVLGRSDHDCQWDCPECPVPGLCQSHLEDYKTFCLDCQRALQYSDLLEVNRRHIDLWVTKADECLNLSTENTRLRAQLDILKEVLDSRVILVDKEGGTHG